MSHIFLVLTNKYDFVHKTFAKTNNIYLFFTFLNRLTYFYHRFESFFPKATVKDITLGTYYNIYLLVFDWDSVIYYIFFEHCKKQIVLS